MANHIPKIIYNSITISFDFPPVDDPLQEKLKSVGNKALAADGSLQYAQQYIERTYKVKLSFVTKTDADAFRTFFEDWGSLGREFDYYQHSDGAATGTFTLLDDNIEFRRILPAASSDFLYEFEFTMREVL
jgi:hypothetical protein